MSKKDTVKETPSKETSGSTQAVRSKKLQVKEVKDKSLSKIIAISSAIVVSLVVIWGIVGTGLYYTHKSAPSATATATTVTKNVRAVTGKSPDQDKQDAVKALTQILKDFDESPNGKNYSDRLTALDNSDYSVVTDKAKNSILINSDTTDEIKTASYQSFITIASLLKSQASDKKTIAPQNDNSWQMAYSDSSLGVVHVPLSLYGNSTLAMSVEMVWDNGVWKVAPYETVDEVKLSVLIQQQMGGNSSTAPTSATTGK